MKNLIYFNNKKEELLHIDNLNKSILKIPKNKEILNTKINELKKNIEFGDYELFINFNHQKIIAYSIVNICKIYIEKNKNKPHIIVSYYESTFIISLCKKLLKENLIEDLTIISAINIIEEFKKYKKLNTLFGFVSNININQYYNLNKLSSYCKYYNIILISNNENILFNYVNTNNRYELYFNNQDILLLNHYAYKNKYYLIYIKKNLLSKYKFFNSQIFNTNISPETLLYLANVINYNNKYLQISNNITTNINNFFNYFKEKYKIVHINEYLTTDKIYFNNCVTIVILNNLFINSITFGLLIPNVKYNSNSIINYLKQNNIIINENHKFNKLLPKEIANCIISINITQNTKITEINKLIKVLDSFIVKNNIPLQRHRKKITFSNPEFIILTKPYKSKSKNKLKSILKKK